MSDEERKKSKLRELYAYKAKLVEKREELLKIKRRADADLEDVNSKLTGVMKGIDAIETRKVYITSHFIDRYRERVDADATEALIRARILTPQFINVIQTLGNGQYPVEDFHVIVEDNKLITCITSDPIKVKLTHKSFVKPRRIRPRKH